MSAGNQGRFRPGPDRRRHVFTGEERKLGYQSAIAAAMRLDDHGQRLAYLIRLVRGYYRARQRRE